MAEQEVGRTGRVLNAPASMSEWIICLPSTFVFFKSMRRMAFRVAMPDSAIMTVALTTAAALYIMNTKLILDESVNYPMPVCDCAEQILLF